jgi:hypothetical protein
MRYQPAHAATSGSVPFRLHGPKWARPVLAAAVAGAIGLVPAAVVGSPAQAAATDYTITPPASAQLEGDDLEFLVSRGTGTTAETLTWNVAAVPAPVSPYGPTQDEDFVAVSGTVAFAAGVTSQTITVRSFNDTMDEFDEQFTLTLTDDAGVNKTSTTATIQDNDAAPEYTLTFDDDSVDEGSQVMVTAELNAVSGKPVNIPITTKDVTAKAGQDYTAAAVPTSLQVPVGLTTSSPAMITTTEDQLYEESTQTFQVLGGSDPTVKATQTGTVTIEDNEDQPTITVGKATAVTEGPGNPLLFPVTMSGPSERQATVTWSTADGRGTDLDAVTAADHGSAQAGKDYAAVPSGIAKFTAATSDSNTGGAFTSATLTVQTLGDSLDEVEPEDMHVTLGSATIAKLGTDVVATGGINDEAADLPPTATLLPSTVTEGNSGKSTKTFTVRLGAASGQRVAVDYATANGTANDGQDYSAATGTLIFDPGVTQKTFTVDIHGDTMYEDAETFTIGLKGSGIATFTPATITINNDDSLPTVSVSPLSVSEGNGGTVAVLPVKLSSSASEPVEIAVADLAVATNPATDSGTTPGAIDYVAPAATLSIPSGQTTGYVYFLINGDDVYEPNEALTIQLTPSGTNVATTVKTATVTITNDDAAPTLTIVNTSAEEGDKVQVRGLTTGVAQGAVQLSVGFKGGSVNGSTPASSADFADPSPVTVTIPAGTFSGASINVGAPLEIVDDTIGESAETVVVASTGFGGGTVHQGVVTIPASDGGVPVVITLETSASVRLGVGTVTLTGTAPPNAALTLSSRAVGSTAWKTVNTQTAGTAGGFIFKPTLSTTGLDFQVWTGDTYSNVVRVSLKQAPRIYASSPSKGQARITVYGNPKTAGLTVKIYRVNSTGTLTTVATSKLDSTGKYVRTLTGLRSGSTYRYKSTVYGVGTRGLLTGTSSTVSVKIR